MKKWRTSVYVIIGIILWVVMSEGLVRVFAPQQLIRHNLEPWALDARYGYRLRANNDTRLNLGYGTVSLITDDAGHRIGRTPPDGVGAYRVLALGDAFVEGTAVEYEQTATGLLEARLEDALNEPVSVVNAGVWGWRPEQYLLREEEELARTDYDLVLIFLYTGKDVVAHRMGDDFSSTVPVYPHPLRIPDDLSAGELVDAVYYPINDFLEARSELYLFFKQRLESLRAGLGLTSGSMPPTLYRAEAASPRWDLTGEIAAEIARAGEAHHTSVMFVIIPTQYEVDDPYLGLYVDAAGIDPAAIDPRQPAQRLRAELEERGLCVIDTSNALRMSVAENGAADVYLNYVHFGADGHTAVTQSIYPQVLEALRQKNRC